MSETFRLGTGDIYDLYTDRRMRRGGGPGNGTQLLYELDGPVDPDDLRARLDRLLEACPVLGAGLETWPGYRWQVRPGHRIPLEIVDEPDVDALALYHRHFRAFPPPEEPSFSVVLAPGERRSVVIFRWLHPLMDAAGVHLLLRLLDGADPAGFKLHDDPPTLGRRARGGSLLRAAVAIHNFLIRYLFRALPPPIQGPWTAGRDTVVRLHEFDEDETEQIDTRVRELAGFGGANHAFLAATFLAAARVLDTGRLSKLLIPSPMDLRPKAWRGPIFANYFSSVLLQLPARALTSLPAAVEAVKVTYRKALKRKEDAAAFFMMSLVRLLPHPLYSLLMLGPTGRDPATLYYAYADISPPDGTLLGLRATRAIGAGQVLTPPGAVVQYWRCNGRLTACVTDRGFDRAEALLGEIVRALRGEAPPPSSA